ncbi:hypothetical protein, partial [Streptomyces griseus]|uniref:hypothetical protein n=1 Tax=Streptomyces griseus TaxID=1911 RepID=UPI00055E06A3
MTEPRHLLVRAQDDSYSWPLLADDEPLDQGLPDTLADRLGSWSLARPKGGFTSRPALRKHVAEGLDVARALAKHLGPDWTVRYWDERHRTEKYVCWGCGRANLTPDAHGTPPHPVHIFVEAEYGWYPLRADGFGDFPPDDPAAALDLSHALVADLNAWSQGHKEAIGGWLDDRDGVRERIALERLWEEGRLLTDRVARELHPGRTVTYRGL